MATHYAGAVAITRGSVNGVTWMGAGMVFLRMFEREGRRDHIVAVTRLFGGKKLGNDRSGVCRRR